MDEEVRRNGNGSQERADRGITDQESVKRDRKDNEAEGGARWTLRREVSK